MTSQNKFDAKDAMKTHASAQAAAAGGWTKEQKIGYAIWGIIAFIVLAAMFNGGNNTPSIPSAPTTAPTQQATLTEDTKKKMALVINLGGELCARVDSIRRIEGDTYAVSCTRYRDGTGSFFYKRVQCTMYKRVQWHQVLLLVRRRAATQYTCPLVCL